MPRRNVERDSENNTPSWREEQRRLRNRLSQKAVRERRAARVRQLEQQLASVTQGGDSRRVTELLNTNTSLRRALLDTRKKLASLSATATQLGEQIKIVLDGHDALEQGSDDTTDHTDMCDDVANYLCVNNSQTSNKPPSSSYADSESIVRVVLPHHDADMELTSQITTADVSAPSLNFIPSQPSGESISTDGMFGCDKTSAPSPQFLIGPCVGPKLHVYSVSTFSQHLDHMQGLLRLGGALDGGSSMRQVVEGMICAFLDHGWPSMKYWFNLTQSTPLAARVLWWQTSSSHEAASQVPAGNTPTFLQLSRLKYPSILDWVPHPGLRDRLILDYESYDVDQVMCDMVNAFVVEIEDNTPILHESHSGVALPIVGRGYSYNLMELVEQTLMVGPMERRNQRDLMAMRLLRNVGTAKQPSIEHRIHHFKLDPRFFDKYPALYDANAESKYRPSNAPFLQISQLPLPFTTNTVKEYMNAALRAKHILAAF